MKLYRLKFIPLLAFLPLILFSFATPGSGARETVTEISYSSGGGRSGWFFYLKVTKDNTILQSNDNTGTHHFIKPTNPEVWQRLSKINLKAFDKIVSSERTAEVDGTDVELSVKTNVKAHSFVNGDYSNSKKITTFVTALSQQMKEVAVRANEKFPE